MRTIYAVTGLLAATMLLSACAAPAPTLEDAGKACVTYVMSKYDETPKRADRTCEIMYEDMGEADFIEEWTR
ncbi:hypothetical protein [Microbacterium sp. Leaf320]|uniref:hypothetical protein n=1 Tax=Microbacterium sp. Leaf320 TaxID=1736334 RepID=UPI0012F98CFC|nr:hypothetical protein [Microbacterium sp. Leaf320]